MQDFVTATSIFRLQSMQQLGKRQAMKGRRWPGTVAAAAAAAAAAEDKGRKRKRGRPPAAVAAADDDRDVHDATDAETPSEQAGAQSNSAAAAAGEGGADGTVAAAASGEHAAEQPAATASDPPADPAAAANPSCTLTVGSVCSSTLVKADHAMGKALRRWASLSLPDHLEDQLGKMRGTCVSTRTALTLSVCVRCLSPAPLPFLILSVCLGLSPPPPHLSLTSL